MTLLTKIFLSKDLLFIQEKGDRGEFESFKISFSDSLEYIHTKKNHFHYTLMFASLQLWKKNIMLCFHSNCSKIIPSQHLTKIYNLNVHFKWPLLYYSENCQHSSVITEITGAYFQVGWIKTIKMFFAHDTSFPIGFVWLIWLCCQNPNSTQPTHCITLVGLDAKMTYPTTKT